MATKSFIALATGVNIIELLYFILLVEPNKLERLPLNNFFLIT
jgi:hypothetical protein